METLEAIGHQRVVRAFQQRPLPDDVVTTILDAGRRTGSSKNLQRWAFITVTDRATLERLSKVGPWCGHIAGAATAIALVTPDPRASDGTAVGDVGPGPRRPEHDPRGVGPGRGLVSRHGLRAGRLPRGAGLSRRTITASSSSAWATRPTRPT